MTSKRLSASVVRASSVFWRNNRTETAGWHKAFVSKLSACLSILEVNRRQLLAASDWIQPSLPPGSTTRCPARRAACGNGRLKSSGVWNS